MLSGRGEDRCSKYTARTQARDASLLDDYFFDWSVISKAMLTAPPDFLPSSSRELISIWIFWKCKRIVSEALDP